MRHLGSFVVTHRFLFSWGGQAYLLSSMWDISSPTKDQTHVPCIGGDS